MVVLRIANVVFLFCKNQLMMFPAIVSYKPRFLVISFS